MRNNLLLLLLFFPLNVYAGWSGIAGYLGTSDSDWLQLGQVREADFTYFGLRIEEKTKADIRVGASVAQFDLRLLETDSLLNIEKFSGERLSLYLRWPVNLMQHLKWHSELQFQYHQGTRNNINSSSIQDETINWSEWVLDLGVSIQIGRLSLRPFVNLRHIDGDISNESGTSLFQLVHAKSSGFIADYYVEPTAFIRLRVTGLENRSVQVSLVREY